MHWFHGIFVIHFRYAKSVGASHFNTSAKLNQGIEELFLQLSQQMMAKADDKAKNTPGGPASSYFNSPRSGGITVVDDSEINQQRQKSGCCSGGGGGSHVVEGQPDPSAVHSQWPSLSEISWLFVNKQLKHDQCSQLCIFDYSFRFLCVKQWNVQSWQHCAWMIFYNYTCIWKWEQSSIWHFIYLSKYF